MVAILLIAAFLRLHGLNNESPPGLEHDEVAHWLINRDILDGNHALYFSEAFGHEAGFHYVQALFLLLLGDNAFVLRLPSALSGLLLIAVSFVLAKRLFGINAALMSAGLLAILFWPIFYSRIALRAIALPVFSGLSAYFWWQAWQGDPSKSAIRSSSSDDEAIKSVGLNTLLEQFLSSPIFWFAVSGIFAGLSFYTYMASRVVPLFYLLYSGYLWALHRDHFRRQWWGILTFFVVYALIAIPLAIFLLTNQGVEVRISEVDQPLQLFLGGNLRPVIENFIAFIAMFGFEGDPLWRQNIASLPVFEPIIAAFFYIGLFISLWRWQKSHYLFIILWLLMSAIPSIVTIDAPSSIRIINALPVIALFPVIGLEVIHFFSRLSTVSTKLSPEFGRLSLILSLLILSILYIARSSYAIFNTWPSNEEVQFVWQQALTEAAGFLDSAAETGPVAIGGWTPETMDPPTMELTLKREDLELRYFDPQQSLIIPAHEDGQISRIVFPAILPLAPDLDSVLSQLSPGPIDMGSFLYYEIAEPAGSWPQDQSEILLDGEIKFLGYQVITGPENLSGEENSPESTNEMNLITYWQVEKPTSEQRRIFLHAVNVGDEQIISQEDALGVPAAHWQPGDVFLQQHSLPLPSNSGPYELRLGVYDPVSGRRLTTIDGSDFISLEGVLEPQ